MWHVFTTNEHRIQVDFVEQFDIRPSKGCKLAGIELKDGGTDVSPSIGIHGDGAQYYLDSHGRIKSWVQGE